MARRPLATAELISADDVRWMRYLAGMAHDVYHLPEYARFAASHQEVGEAAAFIAEDQGQRLLVPLVIREIPPELSGDDRLFDAVSPRGYPGPISSLGRSSEDDDFAGRALDALARVLGERRVISAFVRLHPLLPFPSAALQSRGALVDHGDSVAIDLGPTDDELWRQTRKSHRYDIRRAARLGLTVRMDGEWARHDAFMLAYEQSMERLGAMAQWHLERHYLSDLRASLGDRIHLCVVEDGPRLAGAAVLTEVDGIVEYHLSATMDAYLDTSPSKAIIHFATDWAKARGDRVLHLGGSRSRGDSLHHFKVGFSPRRYPVLTWRLVTDEPRYTALTRRWHALADASSDPAEGYFPAYRRTTPIPVTST